MFYVLLVVCSLLVWFFRVETLGVTGIACFAFLCSFLEGGREKRRVAIGIDEWKRNGNEWAAKTRASTASPPDNAFDLMCHKMMHSWQLPLCRSTQDKSTSTISSPHTLRRTHTHTRTHKHSAIRCAICQDHLDQPPTCWTQSPDKMDLGAPSLFVFPKQNVNNTRGPGEWLKLNTSSLSACLVSDPLWCHVVPLKLWKDLAFLSSVCSATVMQPPMMNYTLACLASGCACMYVCVWVCWWVAVHVQSRGYHMHVSIDVAVCVCKCVH